MELDYPKSCKTTFNAHLSRIWKLTRFTRFIRKVFATKILLSGKFSLFVTLEHQHQAASLVVGTHLLLWPQEEEFWGELELGKEETKDDGGEGIVLKVKVLSVLLSFCSFLILYFACLGSVLEKVSGDMKALANLKYNSNSDKCSLWIALETKIQINIFILRRL